MPMVEPPQISPVFVQPIPESGSWEGHPEGTKADAAHAPASNCIERKKLVNSMKIIRETEG